MNSAIRLYPSIITGDLLALGQMLTELDPYVDGYHIDVMDDHFVPNLTWGAAFIDAIAAATKRRLHIHLMVSDPNRWIDRLKPRSNQDCFIFHYESLSVPTDGIALAKNAKQAGWKVGIAINPGTSPDVILDIIPYIDEVLIMSVEPGFSGQAFLSSIESKIPFLLAHKKNYKLTYDLAVDGGINRENIGRLRKLGVAHFAVASAIFSALDKIKAIQSLRIQE